MIQLSAAEWRLLFTSLTGRPPAADPSLPAVPLHDELVALVEAGQYADVLRHPSVAPLFPAPVPTTNSSEEPKAYYTQLQETAGAGCAADPFLSLIAGVALLSCASQANLTGPEDASLPPCPGRLAHPGGGAAADGAQWDPWAVLQLCADGEEVTGRVFLPQYLLAANAFLVEPEAAFGLAPCDPASTSLTSLFEESDEWLDRAAAAAAAARAPSTRAWWAARACAMQQRLLSKRAVSLRHRLLTLHARVLTAFAPRALESAEFGRRAARVAAAAVLEAALCELEYLRVDAVEDLLARARACCGLEHRADGEMGFRTVHQQDAKAQMVLRVKQGQLSDGDDDDGTLSAEQADPTVYQQARPAAEPVGDDAIPSAQHELHGLGSDCEILPLPKLTTGNADGSATSPLRGLEAALVMAAQALKSRSASDDLRQWEASAYVERVRASPTCPFLVRAIAALETCRHDRQRTRARERGLANLEMVSSGLQQAAYGPPAAARARLAWGVAFPTAAALRQELGHELLGAGLAGAAITLFEQTELWDALVLCLRMLGKRQAAVDLVRSRLDACPDDPRLWCTLGDCLQDEAHYHTAWERSGGKAARAQRSLARIAAERKDFAAAAACWERALAINALHPEGWFALGYAYLKLGQDEKALSAFSRVTSQNPEHGEAWNNVAALCLKKGAAAPALVALQECVKHTRGSWQAWDNLAGAAAQCGKWPQAAEAASKVLELTQGAKGADVAVLEALVGASERDYAACGGAEKVAAQETPEAREAGRQADRVQALLLASANSSAASGAAAGAEGAEVWGLQARLRRARGDSTGAKECAARQLRALSTQPWDKDAAAWARYAAVLAATAEDLLSSSAAASTSELSSVRLTLRGAVKRAEEPFGETEEHKRLKGLLERVTEEEDRKREEAKKAAAA